MRTKTSFGDQTSGTYNCLGLLNKVNLVSRTDNFVIVNVFNSVTSPHVLSYRCVLHYFFKWYYDENRIFPIEAIFKHKQVVCIRRKMPFTFFKYLFSFQRYSSFQNMQISI